MKRGKAVFKYKCEVCGKIFFREAITHTIPLGLGEIGGEPIRDYCSYDCYKNRKKAGGENA